MVMLVALRLVIGWHFFKEGMSHRADPHWSSEGFLKQAKGPLANDYQAVLPKFHQWDLLILAPLPDAEAERAATPANSTPAAADLAPAAADLAPAPADLAPAKGAAASEEAEGKGAKPAPIYSAWLTKVKADWKADQDAFARFYDLDDGQKARAAKIYQASTKQMEEVLKDYASDIRLYRELVYRADLMSATQEGREIPFMKARAANVQKNPLAEAGISGTSAVIGTSPAVWQTEAKGVEQLYHDRLDNVLTKQQRARGRRPAETARLHKINSVVTWLLIIAGGCLIVGLFTRLAALAGALFLLSVICTQPPWSAGAIPTYYQVVEMVALLVLMTTAVGRWGGLDYFIHLLVRPCRRQKEQRP